MVRLAFAGSACLFIFLLVCQNGIATDITHCPPSSCGRNNISYPFRLQSDPISCGDDKYELSCENNSTVLHLITNRGKYYVKTINYDNFSIRVVDASVDKDDCSSIPSFPLTNYSFRFEDPYTLYKYKQNTENQYSWETLAAEMIGFVKCQNPVDSSSYLDTSPCINSSTNSSLSHSGMYSYAYLGDITGNDLRDGCSLEMVSLLLPRRDSKNRISSFVEVHSEIAFGFELSWYNIYCRKCSSRLCYLDNKDHFHCLKRVGTSFAVVLDDIWMLMYTMEYLCMLLIARAICGGPCVAVFLIYKWRRRHLSGYSTIEEFLQTQNNLMPRYAYSDIKKMTGGFKEMLGKGGFGSVYKGKLRSGQYAAVKMLEKSKANGQDFNNEVTSIGRIHHANVVRLIGFCSEGSKHALVYEFMSNGSLDNHIFSPERSLLSLSWEKLYEISLGVARGIEYLHRGCEIQILHFDIKPHNILLNENFTPKVSDFGLAKLYPIRGSIASLTAARGTIGYMAPELFYKNIGRVSYKADVYSFRMLLLEMAGKRKTLKVPAEGASEENLSQIYYPFWVYDKLSDEKLEIEDATEEENEIVRKMIITGLWCIQMQPSNRPPMNKVVEMLEGDLESLQLPPRPLLYPEESMQQDGEQSSFEFSESSSLIDIT